MLERYCDALIIGTELSGLITAAFLARRGLTVHVLDLDPYAQNDKEPDPFCVAHLHSKLLRSILGRLNVPEGDIQFLSATESPLQIIFPKKRIEISSNPVTFYEELEREFPDQNEKIKVFYETLARIKHQVESQQLYSLILPTSFRERRKLMRFVKENKLDQKLTALGLPIDDNATLKNFIMAQLKMVTYAHMESPFAFQVAELLNPSEGEIYSIKGGHHYLKKLFIDRTSHHEGAYRPDAKIEKLLFRDGIFEGVQLSGFDGNVLARYVIWNTSLKRLNHYLPPLFRFRKLRKKIQNLKPYLHWFTAYFDVPREFIPPPMRENLVIIDDPNQDLKGTNFLSVQIQEASSVLARFAVSYLFPPDSLEAENESFFSIHQRIREILLKLLPFADDKLSYAFPLAPNQESEETLFPLKENDFEIFKQTARSHPVFRLEAKSFTDLFQISYKTPSPNFYLTAPEILGSMGYEGKFMLGLKVTDLIWQDVEKEKKRAMKLERRIA